jgi:hypothetical protein
MKKKHNESKRPEEGNEERWSKKMKISSNPRKKFHARDFQEVLKQRAYGIYQERVQRSLSGDDLSDWFQAEEELSHSNTIG